MDDYVSKPIRPGQLQAALERCGLGRGLPVAASDRAGLPGAPGKDAPAEEVFDPVALEAARSLPGAEGPSLLPELVRTFLSDDAARLVRLARLVETRQARALVLEAHAFGGNAAAFGAAQVRRAAIELEEAAEQRNWPAGSARLADLQRACERLRAEVERHNILTP
jgi:HPt (histidine-containing phosphotransfer) domain-containing protein